MTSYRGRFAPSPTGRLHFGSLTAALGSWLFARAAGGRWIVRMEDLDPPREIPGADLDILRTLSAFGLESDEAPVYQSRRTDAYARAFEQLKDLGQVYPCWCSRSDLAPLDGIHPPGCVAAPDPSRAPAWRLRAPPRVVEFDDAIQGRVRQHIAREAGDFVVLRADGWYAYQLAVVVDDAAQGITEIVRGADLVDSTPRQILLQEMLGLPRVRYAHLPLALDGEGRKLSKHERALAVDATDPLPALRAGLAFLGQPVPSAATVDAVLAEALRTFDPRSIPQSAPAPRAFAAMREELS
jgi:glutamyl-Q tRNA(Asp) synthetase